MVPEAILRVLSDSGDLLREAASLGILSLRPDGAAVLEGVGTLVGPGRRAEVGRAPEGGSVAGTAGLSRPCSK